MISRETASVQLSSPPPIALHIFIYPQQLTHTSYYHLWLPGMKSYFEYEQKTHHTVHAIVVVSIFRQKTVLFIASVLTGHRQPMNI